MCFKCESCGCNMTEFEANLSPICENCYDNEVPPVPYFMEDMDGDHDSAMASAGFGTDEDYNHYEDTFDEYMNDWEG